IGSIVAMPRSNGSSLFAIVFVQETVQCRGRQECEGGNEHQPCIEREDACEDLSCRRSDFADGSHSSEEHRCNQKRGQFRPRASSRSSRTASLPRKPLNVASITTGSLPYRSRMSTAAASLAPGGKAPIEAASC